MPSSPRIAPPRRGLMACLCVIGALTLCLTATPAAMSATAVGGGNAFSELTQGGQETTPTTTATTATTETSTTSSSNSSKVVLLALVAAVALLIAIAFVIVRDARRVAPVEDGALTGGPARDTAAQMRKRRAKAKAARHQRKRTRR
ncbi:MAG TPA: hypothetical protein VGL68_09470 [Solirubrobacteraceae bacterium]